jgi:vacuolar-type H+-ATPase subunit H
MDSLHFLNRLKQAEQDIQNEEERIILENMEELIKPARKKKKKTINDAFEDYKQSNRKTYKPKQKKKPNK